MLIRHNVHYQSMTSKTILVLAIAAAFVAGTLISGSAFADHKKGDPFTHIVESIDALVLAIQGIESTVNVDPTPVIVNVGSESVKNVIKANSKTGTTITCPDNSQIIDNKGKTIAMNEFGNLPIFFLVDNQGGSGELFLDMYTAETDGISFEITGIGETRGGAGTCGFSGVPFTFSITGLCSVAAQVDMETSIGIPVTMNADVACI